MVLYCLHSIRKYLMPEEDPKINPRPNNELPGEAEVGYTVPETVVPETERAHMSLVARFTKGLGELREMMEKADKGEMIRGMSNQL